MERKEFSNDPSTEIAEISNLFQTKLIEIKKDMDSLQRLLASMNLRPYSHRGQHFQHIVDYASKKTKKQVDRYQVCLSIKL